MISVNEKRNIIKSMRDNCSNPIDGGVRGGIGRGSARYDFSHAVLGNEESFFRGERVRKLRRVAVLCRSQPRPADAPTEPTAPTAPA